MQIIIVGGGTAGITVAARLKKQNKNFQITIVEPSSYHYYQPLWTLVGGGVAKKESTCKNMADIIPKGVQWIQDYVTGFDPDQNKVLLSSKSEALKYDYLVVCPGIQIDWNKIEGLSETMGNNGVCSNFSYETVDSTWKAFQNTKKGNALFTYPNTTIKCGGAPQKIMYLAEEYFRRQGIRDNINVEYVTAGPRVFGILKYKLALEKIIKERNIKTSFMLNLEKIDGPKKIAYFRNVDTGEMVEKEFEMIHVSPPMSAPDFIKSSALANAEGWVDVDKHTLQHNKYKNVFSLGDASSLPTGKTGAAVRKEAPVLVANMMAVMKEQQLLAKYNGYTSCPLVTGYGKLILAEFDYDGNPVESFPFNQAKERLSMYLLKKYLLPLIYWWGMLKGRM